MAKGDIFADYLRKDPVTRSINRNIKKRKKNQKKTKGQK